MAMSPKDLVGFDENIIDNLVKQIDEKLKLASEHRFYKWFEVTIAGEYPAEVRNEIASRYIDAGWSTIFHQTTTENGERPGLTYFAFLTEETFDIWVNSFDTDKHYMVSKDGVKPLGISINKK